jgi:hypothetical protein
MEIRKLETPQKAIIRSALEAPRQNHFGACLSDRPELFRNACPLTQDEAAPILTRFYMSPPANPGRTGLSVGVEIEKPARFQLQCGAVPAISQ